MYMLPSLLWRHILGGLATMARLLVPCRIASHRRLSVVSSPPVAIGHLHHSRGTVSPHLSPDVLATNN